MNIFIDIETIPEQPEDAAKALIAETIQAPTTMSKPETIADWHSGSGRYAGVKDAEIEKQYRNTSFDGSKGEIISVAFACYHGDVRVIHRNLGESEADLLDSVFRSIRNRTEGRPPYFIGHYISGFDLKFLFQRAVINKVNPHMQIPVGGRHGKDFFDTNMAWAGYGGRISQDNLCKALGIEGKPGDIDGSKVWDFVKAGNVARVAEYNADDVVKVRAIFNRLNFIN